jgi:uncharacterized membrane protein YhaH (DUF805 family)
MQRLDPTLENTMSFAEAIRSVLSQYVGFSGRARRSEYWFWFLAYIIALIVVAIIDKAIGTYPLLYLLVVLAFLLPNLAVAFRRLHDTGRSGWWWLIGIIPIVGGILLIVWFCGDSKPDNQYGPNPKGLPGGAPGAYGSPPSPYGA